MTAKKIMKTLLVLLPCFAFLPGCKKGKRVYTIPDVQNEIMASIREADHHRGKGDLERASRTLLRTGERILKTYPRDTLTFSTVKRFLDTSVRIGNLCLDKGHILHQEAVSNEMWTAAGKYKEQHAKHQELNAELRNLLPELQKAEVSAKAKAESAAAPAMEEPRPGSDTDPADPAMAPSTTDDPAAPVIPTEPGDDLPPIEDPGT